MTAWQLYWLIKLDAIRIALAIPAVATFVILALGVLVWGPIGHGEEDASARRVGKRWMLIGILGLPLFCVPYTLTPTTKQMCAIIVVPKVVNAVAESEALKALPGKVLRLADEWVEELSPKKEAPAEESE